GVRLEAARAQGKESQARSDANRAIEIAEELAATGVEVDALLTQFAQKYSRITELVVALNRIGYASNPRLAHLSAERAIGSIFAPLRLSPTGVLAAKDRTCMHAVCEGVASGARTIAKRVIGGEAA